MRGAEVRRFLAGFDCLATLRDLEVCFVMMIFLTQVYNRRGAARLFLSAHRHPWRVRFWCDAMLSRQRHNALVPTVQPCEHGDVLAIAE